VDERDVVLAPQAQADLTRLYDYIAVRSGNERALGYIERIEAFCRGLSAASERGTRRDDLLAGLRTIGFERRITVAFGVSPRRVTILRILYGGRDLGRALPTDQN
jgi:toxin ParE1/3/4